MFSRFNRIPGCDVDDDNDEKQTGIIIIIMLY